MRSRIVSQRGVVFFRDQEVTAEEQKELVQRLGELSGELGFECLGSGSEIGG